MADPRIEKLARLLVEYSVEIREGDKLALMAGPVAEPLVRELYRAAVRAGAFVEPVIELPGLREILLKEGSRQQLEHVSPFRREIVDNFDVRIAIDSAVNTRELSGVDPERQQIQSRAGRPLGQKWMERSARGEARWVVAMFPTHARAQEADMSLTEFEDFAYSGCLLDESDPIAAWRGVRATAGTARRVAGGQT